MKKRVLKIFLLIFFLSIFGRGYLFAFETNKKANPRKSKPATTSKATSSADGATPLAKKSPPSQIQSPALNKDFLHPVPIITKYNEPMDLIELIPVVRDINRLIPRRFSLVNHQFTLSPDQMVIQHQFNDIRSKTAVKNSIVSLSYYGDFGRSLSTRLDVPLFYSSIFGFSDWSRYPLGNYTMTINRTDFINNGAVYIKAQTRF